MDSFMRPAQNPKNNYVIADLISVVNGAYGINSLDANTNIGAVRSDQLLSN
jgi:hypothetical protein